MEYVAAMTPQVRCFPWAPAVVLRQRSIARAPSKPSTESICTFLSQPVGSSSATPLQSSSIPFPGTSKAPGLMFGSQSSQSPSLPEKPSPSWSVLSESVHIPPLSAVGIIRPESSSPVVASGLSPASGDSPEKKL
jgi:hypothetical protein